MTYLLLKSAHMSLAALSGALFLARAMWMLTDSPLRRQAWVRHVPHLVDSLLLATALVLAWWSAPWPIGNPWLTAKLSTLVAYIVLGSVALKYGKTRTVRAAACIGALACYGYIVGTAITKNPLFFL